MAKTPAKPTKAKAAAPKRAAKPTLPVANTEDLTQQQRAFVVEYLKDTNGGAAYLRAGYRAKTRAAADSGASVLLRVPKVAAAIQSAMDRRAEKCEISASDVLESIKEIRARCMQHTPVMRKVDGELVQKIEDGQGVWEFDSRGALKANELLGKHLKLFTERVEIEGNVALTVVTGVPDGDEA